MGFSWTYHANRLIRWINTFCNDFCFICTLLACLKEVSRHNTHCHCVGNTLFLPFSLCVLFIYIVKVWANVFQIVCVMDLVNTLWEKQLVELFKDNWSNNWTNMTAFYWLGMRFKITKIMETQHWEQIKLALLQNSIYKFIQACKHCKVICSIEVMICDIIFM